MSFIATAERIQSAPLVVYDDTGGQTIPDSDTQMNLNTVQVESPDFTLSNNDILINRDGLLLVHYLICVDEGIGSTSKEAYLEAWCEKDLLLDAFDAINSSFARTPCIKDCEGLSVSGIFFYLFQPGHKIRLMARVKTGKDFDLTTVQNKVTLSVARID